MAESRKSLLRRGMLALAAAVLLTLAMLCAALADSYPLSATATAKVNMRKTASSNGTVITQVPKGDTVTVTGVYGGYYVVTYNGKSGYILKSFLNVSSSAATATPKAAATAVPASGTSASGYVTLSKGSSGAAVKALESALQELGYFSGTPNDTFDSTTESAVKKWQTKNSFEATGIMDANAQALLYYGKPLNSAGKATKVYTLAPLDSVVMHLNNKGDLVTTVQTRLKELGYYTGTVDGIYNKKTISAMRTFQKKHKLTADGACKQADRAILLSSSALPAKATATPKATKTPKPTASPTPMVTPSATVQQGSSGTNARLVQQRLKALGYYTGTVDGYFGAASVNALKVFQNVNGLKETGVLDASGRKVLFSTTAMVKPTATPKPTKTPKPTATPKATATPRVMTTPSAAVKKGSSGANAKMVQQRLKDLGYYTGTVDGSFGTGSVAALKVFQQTNGLTASGTADTSTYAVLFSSSAIAFGGSEQIPTTKTLKKGSTGSSVKLLQTRLQELGYYTGKINSSFDAATQTAVKAFQQNNGLTADGIAGVTTIEKMNSASAKSAPTATPTPKATATPKPIATPTPTAGITVKASDVIYANFYTKVRPIIRQYQYATIYDYETGASWQIHMFSFGNHAEYEPVTEADTEAMWADMGKTWNPRPVWVLLSNGQVYIATIHSMPHGCQHNKDNGFSGHACLHFPRTLAQVKSIGPYATSHQTAVDKAWTEVQAMAALE